MTDYTVTPEPCGCSIDGRCDVHAAMMRALQTVYRSDDLYAFEAVGRFVDGFGTPGSNIGDWSAWRDASLDAIERAWRESVRLSAAAKAAGRAEFARRVG